MEIPLVIIHQNLRRVASPTWSGHGNTETQMLCILSILKLAFYSRCVRYPKSQTLHVYYRISFYMQQREEARLSPMHRASVLLEMTTFCRSYITSNLRSILTMALSCTVFDIFDIEKCCNLGPGHWKNWYRAILAFDSNCVSKMHFELHKIFAPPIPHDSRAFCYYYSTT